MTNKKALVVSTLVAALYASAAYAETELTVYTAVEAEDLQRYAETFNQDHPDIKINWVRDSTGVVTAKLLAEKNNPQADVVWGLAGTSLLVLKTEGMLEPYAPKGLELLQRIFPRQRQSANVGGNGRLGRFHLLQHGGRRKAWPDRAQELEGPDQA